MKSFRSSASLFRKLILVGWALAVVWIYLGNLVNFHQNRIWGKQLIPVACYSTRAKEKDGLFAAKKDSEPRLSLPGMQFDFTTPCQAVSEFTFITSIPFYYPLATDPVLQQDFLPFSFRGPPAA